MRQDVDIGLRPGGSISGRVLDGEEAPVADAYVELLTSYRSRRPLTAKSDDDGRYRFRGLARGARYAVQAVDRNAAVGAVLGNRVRELCRPFAHHLFAI